MRNGPVVTIVMNRPKERNCVNKGIADKLLHEIIAFDKDPTVRGSSCMSCPILTYWVPLISLSLPLSSSQLSVCVLHGEGAFCAGADLKNFNNLLSSNMDDPAPMGITRYQTSKPVIASISGFAVAGGIELALWCDLRVVEEDATMGVFCRRFGVPLIDGGTVRLPRLIGRSRALDLILTGRPVSAQEAKEIGLANRVAKKGTVRQVAESLALEIAAFPQTCLRNDRRSALDQENLSFKEAMKREFGLGEDTINSGETLEGARKFQSGVGRGGAFGKSKL